MKELLGQNQSKTVFLNAQMVNGAFRDPWGTPYRFRILSEARQNEASEDFGAAITFPNRHRFPR